MIGGWKGKTPALPILPHINQARLLTTLYGENKISADVMKAIVKGKM
jgi:hypothetical protein